MESFYWVRVEQQIREFELIQRAGEAAEELVSIIQETPYEDLNPEICKLIGCSPDEATLISHLSLDRLSPSRISLIGEELENLRHRYFNRK